MTYQEGNYPLFVALTRSPMIMGLTQTYFVLSLTPIMIFFLITKSLVITALLFAVAFIIGRIACHKDERYFELLLGRLELSCPNRSFWGCNSYDPS